MSIKSLFGIVLKRATLEGYFASSDLFSEIRTTRRVASHTGVQ